MGIDRKILRQEDWTDNAAENFPTLLSDRQYATLANAIVSVGFTPNGTHFEP